MNPNAARLMEHALIQAGPEGMTWEVLHAELLQQDVPTHQIGQLIADYDRRGLIARKDGRLVLVRAECATVVSPAPEKPARSCPPGKPPTPIEPDPRLGMDQVQDIIDVAYTLLALTEDVRFVGSNKFRKALPERMSGTGTTCRRRRSRAALRLVEAGYVERKGTGHGTRYQVLHKQALIDECQRLRRLVDQNQAPTSPRARKMNQATRRTMIVELLRDFPEGLSPQEVLDEIYKREGNASLQTVYSDLQDLARQGAVVGAGATSRRIYYHPELAPTDPQPQQRRQDLAQRLNEIARQLQQISREIGEAQPR